MSCRNKRVEQGKNKIDTTKITAFFKLAGYDKFQPIFLGKMVEFILKQLLIILKSHQTPPKFHTQGAQQGRKSILGRKKKKMKKKKSCWDTEISVDCENHEINLVQLKKYVQ